MKIKHLALSALVCVASMGSTLAGPVGGVSGFHGSPGGFHGNPGFNGSPGGFHSIPVFHGNPGFRGSARFISPARFYTPRYISAYSYYPWGFGVAAVSSGPYGGFTTISPVINYADITPVYQVPAPPILTTQPIIVNPASPFVWKP
jgi:hypothetical protein